MAHYVFKKDARKIIKTAWEEFYNGEDGVDIKKAIIGGTDSVYCLKEWMDNV